MRISGGTPTLAQALVRKRENPRPFLRVGVDFSSLIEAEVFKGLEVNNPGRSS